ncbi:hypothetical protein [Marinicellulosiphila megalodicopiae]|uniref:hypothetical protein n=1 Tax=Marinicellulosiphila megalodicopiae TaxID=2724896 RepID=UPI003BAFBC87
MRITITFILTLLISLKSFSNPPEIIKLTDTLSSIPGVIDVEIGKLDIEEIEEDHFGLLPFAEYPLGAISRTQGGKDKELVIYMDFKITPDAKGLRALEFISWWVKDEARAGSPMQIRSVALPPIIGQFGNTLKFTIDYFYIDPNQDIKKLISTIGEIADDLELMIELYKDVIFKD